VLETPVALLIFNRPDVTERVFNAIAAARPKTLLVVADGPRADRAGEAEKCRATRAIIERVDWPCDVRRNFSETNLGCKRRVSSGLDWVFQQEDRAIILEDDILPDPTFFGYCRELLERFASEPRIMHISGDNFQPNGWTNPYSYYFSKLPHIWGWATWRRAWQLYDVTMRDWPEKRQSGWISTHCPDPLEARLWTVHFDQTHAGKIDTWDHQWTFTCWKNGGLCVAPAVNLASNIGFGPEATHTTQASALGNLPTRPIGKLVHPLTIERGAAEDQYEFEFVLDGQMLRKSQRLDYRLKRLARRTLRGLGLRR
jgi:hypothetical protein